MLPAPCVQANPLHGSIAAPINTAAPQASPLNSPRRNPEAGQPPQAPIPSGVKRIGATTAAPREICRIPAQVHAKVHPLGDPAPAFPAPRPPRPHLPSRAPPKRSSAAPFASPTNALASPRAPPKRNSAAPFASPTRAPRRSEALESGADVHFPGVDLTAA